MIQKRTEEQIIELMDMTFSEGPEAPVYQELQVILAEQPEYQALWEEYLSLKRGMDALEQESAPLELTDARVLKAAREKTKKGATPKVSRGWRILLSQPLVAAATVVLIIGVGVYSQVWMKRQTERQDFAPKMAPTQVEEIQVLDDTALEPKEADRAPVKSLAPAVPPPAKKESPKARRKKQIEGFAPTQPSGETGYGREVHPGGSVQGVGGMVQDKLDRDQAPSPAKPQAAPRSLEMKSKKAPEAAPSLKALDTAMEREAREEIAPRGVNPYFDLLRKAKIKMGHKDYSGALQDLLEAQKFKDSEEIRKLIAECRAEIRLLENP